MSSKTVKEAWFRTLPILMRWVNHEERCALRANGGSDILHEWRNEGSLPELYCGRYRTAHKFQ